MSGKKSDGAPAMVTVGLALLFGLGTGGASCDDQVDRLDADHGGAGEMGVDADMGDGGPEADRGPDVGDGEVDLGDAEVDAIVDADLRTCDAGAVGEPCSEGRGACRVEGVERCSAEGRFVCDAVPGMPSAERCDGIDQDCDGVTDEDAPPQSCYTADDEDTEGVGVCKTGMWACPTGPDASDVCEGEITPTAEVCNGVDDDCDGAIDEEAPPVPCYEGPEGTAGVGRCRAGQTRCPTGPEGPGPCEGQVGPAEEICDGVEDEDCDGAVDVADGVAVCGELVADHCRAWLAWTADDLPVGDDLESVFDTWGDCPLAMDGEDDQGRSRCTNTMLSRELHTLVLPAGELMDDRDKLGIRWHCEAPVFAEPALVDALRAIQRDCRITLGEQWSTEGPDVQDEWPPCPLPGAEPVTGIDGFSRCTTTFTDGIGDPRFRALPFTARFGENTDVAIAFHCAGDAPILPSVQTQTAIWLGWAARPLTPDTWAACGGVDRVEEDGLRCVNTSGDGRFHRLRVNALLPADAADFDPGVFGIGVRPRVPAGEGAR